MRIYDNEKDAIKCEGIIVGISDDVYDDISIAEDDFSDDDDDDVNVFGFYVDRDRIKVAWN